MSRREYPDYPRIGVGAVVVREGKILMVKRGSPPGENLWAIPGGLLELGESLQEGAEREIFEETGVRIKAGQPVYAFDFLKRDAEGRLRFHYVIVDLEATYLTGEIRAADDAIDVRWVSAEDCRQMPVSDKTLKLIQELDIFAALPEKEVSR